MTLTHQVIIETGSTLPVAGVLAHEWAHQVQFAFGWYDLDAPTMRDNELEADAFSGFYVGLEENWASSQLGAYLQTLFDLGDFHFNDRHHHGTPNMRLAAG